MSHRVLVKHPIPGAADDRVAVYLAMPGAHFRANTHQHVATRIGGKWYHPCRGATYWPECDEQSSRAFESLPLEESV